MSKLQRILSIQSHVVSGHVGNKSAVFPLQLLGFDVDAINSVQFSNHTGYPFGVRGLVLNDVQLEAIFEGLSLNDLTNNYSHIITGYIGSASFLLKTASIIKELKIRNPRILYVCDPVMGDTGPGLYVPSELIPLFREKLIPLSDIILPNQFEAELLTGISIQTESDALLTLNKLRSQMSNPSEASVFLSSLELKEGLVCALALNETGIFKIEIPKIPVAFVGAGDLFTALITAWLHISHGDLTTTLEKVMGTMISILNKTYQNANGDFSPRKLELKIIQSKTDIESPKTEFRVERLSSSFSNI